MEPQNQTDHIALLALMICGTLIKRLDELGQLDQRTAQHVHQLVIGVRTHAKTRGISDLTALFDNLDQSLATKLAYDTKP